MTLYQAEIYVTLKSGVLDPQGQALQTTLSHMGFDQVQNLRVGKFLELSFEADTQEQAQQQAIDMCEKLLTNTVIEDYKITFKA